MKRPSVEPSISFAMINDELMESEHSEESPHATSNINHHHNHSYELNNESDDKIFIDLESPKTIHPSDIEEEKQLLQYTDSFMINRTKDEEYQQNLDDNLELVRKDLMKNSLLLHHRPSTHPNDNQRFNISDYYIRSESPISLSGNHTPSITYGSNGSNSNNDTDDDLVDKTEHHFISTKNSIRTSEDTFSGEHEFKKKERTSKDYRRIGSHYSLPSYKTLKQTSYKARGLVHSNKSETDKHASLPREHVDTSVHRFKQLSYEEVEKSLCKYYDKENRFSNEMDLLITYLKGQRNLYTQCKNYSQSQLNSLFIPSLFITSTVALLSNYGCSYNSGGILISCLNAIATVLISLINYLKLETNTNNYDKLATEYDKLETSLELTSNRISFYHNNNNSSSETQTKKEIKKQNDSLLTKIRETEDKISEIKERYSILVPEYIKKIFPVICHINIFSFIQKIENYKKTMIFEFRDIKNEIRYMIYKWNKRGVSIFDEIDENGTIEFHRDKYRFAQLIRVKEDVKKKLINYKNAYSYIDEIFSREIKNAESCYHWIFLFFFCKSIQVKYSYSNPVISEFLRMVFTEDI